MKQEYKWKKWKFWKRVRDWCNTRMTAAWMKGGNCDSACPKCHQWESHGNVIETEPQEDGSELRSCNNCGYAWKAIFTPAGFVPIDSMSVQGAEE